MKKIIFLFLVTLLTACSGIRQSGDHYTVHAENLNILGLQIPMKSDQERAVALLPRGAVINTQTSNPSDWTSVLGVINRIIGISYTEISGTVGEPNV